ncbi:hypothetical protein MRX96_039648 [Rhipicephalus microplus]
MHEGKSVSDYIAALNKLVDDCNIGGVHERVMRDQIVCGINDTGMQTRLLESVENLETTKNFVVAIETARKDSHMLGAPSVFADMVQSANFVEQPTRKMTEVMCARCSSKHQTTRCRNTACFKCGQKGHLARVCKTAANNGRNCTGSCSVHNMNDLPETELGQGEEYTLWSLRATGPKPMKIKACVNNVPLVIELDTGASVSIISGAKFNALFPGEPLEHTDMRLKSYSGELSAVLGKMSAIVNVGAQKATFHY